MTDPIWTRRSTQIVEVSSAQPDADPVWVDISVYVLMVGSGQAVSISRGRQTELAQADPSRLSVVLNNSDDRFTPGNPTSPYVAWWKQGRRIRWREKLGPWVFDLVDGYLQLPEVVIQVAGKDQILTVSAVDRLARLDQPGTEFVSALGEYILSTADLVGYWPLTDPNPPFGGVGPVVEPMLLDTTVFSGGASNTAQVLPQQGVGPAGGELGALRLTTGKNDSGVPVSGTQISWPLAFEPAVAASDAVTVVMWVAVTGTTFAGHQTIAAISIGGTTTLEFYRDNVTGAWTLVASGAMTGTITLGAVGDALLPVGIRFVGSTSTLEFWTGGQRTTTTLTGSAPGVTSLFQGNFNSGPDLDISHIQAYVGQTYSYTDFQAQIAQGYTPLERQPTGARVGSILDYAGVPAGVRDIDTGSAVMATAVLAGQTPLSALRQAETTERGLIFTDGRGQILFRDRVRRYNL